MKSKLNLLGILLTALLLLTIFTVEAATGTDWNVNAITATGSGIAPVGTVGAQAKGMARRAAIADAQRQLVEAVYGVQVDAETTVEQMTVTSDVIRTRVSGVLRGAQIVDEGFSADGAYEVTMQLPMFGDSGIAQAVLPRPAQQIPFPTPKAEQGAPVVTAKGGYTGVIIDCRGLGVNPVMSPVIKDSNGLKIYGHQNLDYDLVIRDGMASYAHDTSEASRAGKNPLVIKAVSMDDHNANPVISVSDGNRLLVENNSAGFLAKTAVVFLY